METWAVDFATQFLRLRPVGIVQGRAVNHGVGLFHVFLIHIDNIICIESGKVNFLAVAAQGWRIFGHFIIKVAAGILYRYPFEVLRKLQGQLSTGNFVFRQRFQAIPGIGGEEQLKFLNCFGVFFVHLQQLPVGIAVLGEFLFLVTAQQTAEPTLCRTVVAHFELQDGNGVNQRALIAVLVGIFVVFQRIHVVQVSPGLAGSDEVLI